MLGFAWLTLRQAQEAFKTGRLEEGRRLLQEPGMMGQKGSWELLQQIGRGFVERGQRHLKHEDTMAAWNDLLQAEGTGLSDDSVGALRLALVRHGLGQARSLLEAGEPSRAATILDGLHDRGVRQMELQLLLEVANGWIKANEQAATGEFAEAMPTVTRIVKLLPTPPAALVAFRSELEHRSRAFADSLPHFIEAADRQRWRDALPLAEKILAVAPQHVAARKVRARAWKSIEPVTVALERQGEGKPSVVPAVPGEPSRRYMLWIDGIGGYLICLGNRITIGQATPPASVDVPLYADVSRMHAAVVRDSEGYMLEAIRPTAVNGQPIDKALLQPGDRVTVGTCCQMTFTQPVPVSATAQFSITSGHRLPLAVDNVFLMADTLVLSPGPQAHVVIPDLRQAVVLFRNKDGLGVRYPGDLVVDGVPCRERGVLGAQSRVSGDDFAFAVELLGSKMGAA